MAHIWRAGVRDKQLHSYVRITAQCTDMSQRNCLSRNEKDDIIYSTSYLRRYSLTVQIEHD